MAYPKFRKGSRYGKLTVVNKETANKNECLVICDCKPNIKDAFPILFGLLRKHRSCGCAVTQKSNKDPGIRLLREYRAYCSMMEENFDEVCSYWKKSFNNFVSDVGACPMHHKFKRIDREKPYCKENCKWVY